MSFDQPQRPSPSIVPTPQQVAAYLLPKPSEEPCDDAPLTPAQRALRFALMTPLEWCFTLVACMIGSVATCSRA